MTGGRLFATAGDRIRTVDPVTGDPGWSAALPPLLPGGGRVVAMYSCNGTIAVELRGRSPLNHSVVLFGLDAANGNLRWQVDLPQGGGHNGGWSLPLVVAGPRLIEYRGNRVQARDGASGQVVWNQPFQRVLSEELS